MGRLTECHNGVAVIKGKKFGEAAAKLAKYEDAEEQGLLVKLPCKVGDTLYKVICSVEEYKVTAIGIYENKIVICTDNLNTGIGFSFDANRIGKRYFLTKEEAEAALAKMERRWKNDKTGI